MKISTNPICLKHLTGSSHPECPERYLVVCQALEKAGLKNFANTLPMRRASLADLLLCHTLDYIELVQTTIKKLTALEITDGTYQLSTGDVQVSPYSWEAAIAAVGSVLEAVDTVLNDGDKRVFCPIRPPGHHACHNKGMGFCLFNQVAIGARYAQQHYPIERVLIVDWDVHHGNGTQDIFDDDPTIFYFSTHQAGIYPGTGLSKDSGVGLAKGTKFNRPILPGLAARTEILDLFKFTLAKKMHLFKPQLVLISAGFDAHQQDPLGNLNLTENDFSLLTQAVCQVANDYAEGRVISVLEGGYHLEALASSVVAHVTALAI